jgi:8-oxo-dGTP pyrophosphatase MutT (NUDIX family)
MRMDDEIKITHHYAGVLLVTDDGKLIGQQRDAKQNIDNPGKVATFGGTVEEGEEYRHAAWRELVEEETNLKIPETSLELFLEDTSWRPLTNEWEARHFYLAKISNDELDNLEVYEGKGWVEIADESDPRLVDAWRIVIKTYLAK